jgi:hypothetical protein
MKHRLRYIIAQTFFTAIQKGLKINYSSDTDDYSNSYILKAVLVLVYRLFMRMVGVMFRYTGKLTRGIISNIPNPIEILFCGAIVTKSIGTIIESQKVIAENKTAIIEITQSRQIFEKDFKERFIEKHNEIEYIFGSLDAEMEKEDYYAVTQQVTYLARSLSIGLELVEFEEFDNYIKSSKEPLLL